MNKSFLRISLVVAFFAHLSPILLAQKNPSQQLLIDVAYLASDLLEGRGTGTEGEAKAAAYIVSRFDAIGLEAKGSNGWFQGFDFRHSSNPHADKNSGERINGKNVVGYLDNGADKTIVLGAHYDHLGYGEVGSRHVGEKAIHNGADDNASGVAAIIEIARQLKASNFKNHNYAFVAFSGEEYGLYGSKYFVANMTIPEEGVNCMINLDMVGRLDEDNLLINGVGTSPSWKELIKNQEGSTSLNIKTTESGIGASDHTSFYLADIPAVHFFTGAHSDYHKPIDDSHLINYEGIQTISDYIVAMIKDLDKMERMEFTKTADEQTRTVSSFKVTLGVMPDYVHEEKGMRIDAAMEDRPAKKAGMKKGDVLIKLGDVDIDDIYKYMEALGKFEKGQTVKAVVLRNGKKVKMDVTF